MRDFLFLLLEMWGTSAVVRAQKGWSRLLGRVTQAKPSPHCPLFTKAVYYTPNYFLCLLDIRFLSHFSLIFERCIQMKSLKLEDSINHLIIEDPKMTTAGLRMRRN